MNIEEQAREQGWVTKEEWKGDPEKWTTAEVFVDKGERLAPILKSKIERQDQEINKLKQANREFGEFSRSVQERLHRENKALLEQLEAQRAKAIDDGDGQEFTRVDREIKNLEVKPANGESNNPLGDAWLLDNSWYNDNHKLRVYANGLAEEIIAEGYTGQAYFNELTRRVKQDNPKEFENPNKSKANTVEYGGDIEIKNSKAKTYENLPPDAKAACDSFEKRGLSTKEDYLKNYEWDK